MKLQKAIPAWAVLVHYATAVDVTLMEDEGCNAYGVFGGIGIPSVTCYDITVHESYQSVDVRDFSPNQIVRFFSDHKCNQEVYTTGVDACYNTKDIQAFTVQNITVSGASHQLEASESTTTDIEPYNMKMSNYQGMDFAPAAIRIPLSNFQIGTLLVATAASVNFANAVTGCVALSGGTDPLTLFGCLGPPVATVLTAVGGYFLSRQGSRARGHIDMALGTVDDTNYHSRSRRSIMETIDGFNAEYMHSTMNVTGNTAMHNGLYMRRDLGYGEQTSPIYELVGPGDNVTYHITAFWDERSASFMHHIAPEQSVMKRQDNYDDIRWSANGLDFSFCRRNAGANLDVFNKSMEDLYDAFYSEFSCTVDRDDLANRQQLLVDLYNGDKTLVGEVHIAPYVTGGPVNNNAYVITECTMQGGAVNQQCIA